jgi:hypothetical protein
MIIARHDERGPKAAMRDLRRPPSNVRRRW